MVVARKSNESNERSTVWMIMNRRTFQVITAVVRGHTSKSMNRTSHNAAGASLCFPPAHLQGVIGVGHTRQHETSCLRWQMPEEKLIKNPLFRVQP